MKRFLLLLVPVIVIALQPMAAQPIPGRYIVEFQTEPAASVLGAGAAAGRTSLAAVAGAASARRAQIQTEHAAVEPAIRALGGTVMRRYDTVFNGMAVTIGDQAAPRLAALPGVRGVYPDRRHKLFLDHMVKVHQITDAWQTLPNGMAGAGAGMKIGMLDTGIDINHPGFQGFSTAVPSGFPIVSSPLEAANTNNKVIVSRDYTGDGGLDAVVGHGTGTSMIAAGLTNDPGLTGVTPLTGAAPGAWLGNYRVLNDSGEGSTSWFLAALQDAVNDGMNVVNYSAGAPVTDAGAETGPEARAINAAVAAGTIVVIAAGNSGPAPGTIGDPGVAAGALTAGSNDNERFFDFAVTVDGVAPYLASIPSSELGFLTVTQVSGPVTDVTALDGTGYGCTAFAANSLSGQIALISRGGPGGVACTFDLKLNNAQDAGAIGAVVYDNQAEATLVDMALATAVLPATFISQASGQDLQMRVDAAPGLNAAVDFTGFVAFPQSSSVRSSFSGGGPTPGAGLKPDVLGTGSDVLTAYTTLDPNFFGPPYQLGDGTSFSAPIVTGSLAVLMAARPGLTAAQYRSLIVNSANSLTNSDGTPMTPQVGGTGKMNLLNALENNLTAAPSAVDFQTAAGSVDATQTVTFTNAGTAQDTFTVVVNAINTSGPAPTVSMPTFTLAPGASQAVSVQLSGTGLAPGEYHGFLTVTGTQTSVSTNVPYWFGAPGNAVQNIGPLLYDPYSSGGFPYSAGDSATIIVRTTDLIGMPFDAGAPQATVTGVRGSATVTATGNIPGTYQVNVRVGRADANGLNVVTLTAAGGVSTELALVVQ